MMMVVAVAAALGACDGDALLRKRGQWEHVVDMSKQPFIVCLLLEARFASARNFDAAAPIVLGTMDYGDDRDAFQHYGRQDRILSKIVQQRWWLAWMPMRRYSNASAAVRCKAR